MFIRAVLLISCFAFTKAVDPIDATLLPDQMVAKYNYPVEVHQVGTEDNYILTLYRIPGKKHGQQCPSTCSKPVALLGHGLVNSGAHWIIPGPDYALSFLLADYGYDVWMVSYRGAGESVAHRIYRPSSVHFWKFSFHEMGVFDLPATIDYILAKTGCDDLAYISHSQGSAAGMVMLSKRPEYNEKVRVFVAYAPAVYLQHIGPVYALAAQSPFTTAIIRSGFDRLNIQPFLDGTRPTSSQVCRGNIERKTPVCVLFEEYVLDLYNGTSPDLYEIFMTHSPATTSFDCILHLLQSAKTDKFAELDPAYQPKYRYPLEKVTTDVHVFYGSDDHLVAPTDVEKLIDQLSPYVKSKHYIKQFSHNDFIISTLAWEKAYEPTRKILDEAYQMN